MLEYPQRDRCNALQCTATHTYKTCLDCPSARAPADAPGVLNTTYAMPRSSRDPLTGCTTDGSRTCTNIQNDKMQVEGTGTRVSASYAHMTCHCHARVLDAPSTICQECNQRSAADYEPASGAPPKGKQAATPRTPNPQEHPKTTKLHYTKYKKTKHHLAAGHGVIGEGGVRQIYDTYI